MEREDIAALGCAACHDDLQAAGVRAAPDLRLSVGNMKAEFLSSYLASPHSAQPDSRMPDLLAGLAPEERALAATELAAFLRSTATTGQSAVEPARGSGDESAKRGDQLYHELGCVMCHGARRAGPNSSSLPSAPDGARSLDHVEAKYTPQGLASFLGDPLAHRPAGLMPNMHLNRGEARDLATYLSPGSAASVAGPAAPDAELIRGGRERFRALNCASCHSGVDDAAPTGAGPALANPSGGCLADAPKAGVPHYHLSEERRAALRSSITTLGATRSLAEQVDDTFTAFRCTACHERAGVGGVPADLDGFLATDEPDLGEYARRPPRLDGVGGKLRLSWLERVLYDGASVRPYMHTRMPVFGAENLAHLPALLEEVDAQAPLEFVKATGEHARPARDGAQKLLGVTGLGCVSCHVFNTKAAPSFQGLDLITTPERLRERWLKEFLIAPQSKLPGIVMPESWSGGVAAYDSILDGDTDKQISAIWHYLTLGRSARDPVGIAQPRWDVNVEDKPLVYRGRSRVAGFRGVAVGFPEGIHFAFDANNGALAAIWKGDFVSVNWNGQGAGDFNPRARAIELARDTAQLKDVDEETTWPLRPITTKEEPINADPTYPRQHGYRFRGYHQDPQGIPTLRYLLHDVLIEDRALPVNAGERLTLKRQLTFNAESPTRVTFRALTGDIEMTAPGEYRIDGLALTVLSDKARLHPLGEAQELLIDLELPAGRTLLEMTYDLVD